MRALLIALTMVVAVPAARAHKHRAFHIVDGFLAAWNARDLTAMQGLWTIDGTGTDAGGRAAYGRGAVAGLFVASSTPIRVTSPLIEQRLRAGVVRVDFDAEIAGARAHVTAELVWGPDLLGGHHPDGRYFLSSLTITLSQRSHGHRRYPNAGMDMPVIDPRPWGHYWRIR